jgi:hypothetical protein
MMALPYQRGRGMALKKCTSDGAIKVSIDIIIFIFEIAP